MTYAKKRVKMLRFLAPREPVYFLREADCISWEIGYYERPAQGMKGWHWVRDGIWSACLVPSRRLQRYKDGAPGDVPDYPAEGYRCQFCEKHSPVAAWEKLRNSCPFCGKQYDAILAQEGDD